MMREKTEREIVIEIEIVRRIRKRARTTLDHCSHCGKDVDLLDLDALSELLEMDEGSTAALVADTSIHRGGRGDADNRICAASLISVLESRAYRLETDEEEMGGRNGRLLGRGNTDG